MKSAKFNPPAATRTRVCPGFSVGSAASWMASASGPDRLVITKAFMGGSLAGRFPSRLIQRRIHDLATKNEGGPWLEIESSKLNSDSKGTTFPVKSAARYATSQRKWRPERRGEASRTRNTLHRRSRCSTHRYRPSPSARHRPVESCSRHTEIAAGLPQSLSSR